MEISGQCDLVFFFLAVSPVSLTELCSFWYSLSDVFSLHKLVDKAVLTVKSDDVTRWEVFFQIVIKGFEKKKKKKSAKTLFGVPRATFDPKRERLIGP